MRKRINSSDIDMGAVFLEGAVMKMDQYEMRKARGDMDSKILLKHANALLSLATKEGKETGRHYNKLYDLLEERFV